VRLRGFWCANGEREFMAEPGQPLRSVLHELQPGLRQAHQVDIGRIQRRVHRQHAKEI